MGCCCTVFCCGGMLGCWATKRSHTSDVLHLRALRPSFYSAANGLALGANAGDRLELSLCSACCYFFVLCAVLSLPFPAFLALAGLAGDFGLEAYSPAAVGRAHSLLPEGLELTIAGGRLASNCRPLPPAAPPPPPPQDRDPAADAAADAWKRPRAFGTCLPKLSGSERRSCGRDTRMSWAAGVRWGRGGAAARRAGEKSGFSTLGKLLDPLRTLAAAKALEPRPARERYFNKQYKRKVLVQRIKDLAAALPKERLRSKSRRGVGGSGGGRLGGALPVLARVTLPDGWFSLFDSRLPGALEQVRYAALQTALLGGAPTLWARTRLSLRVPHELGTYMDPSRCVWIPAVIAAVDSLCRTS